MKKKYLMLLSAAVLLPCALMTAQAIEADPVLQTAETASAQETQEELNTDAQTILNIQESYKAYAALVSQYEEKYGIAALDTREYSNVMTGLCFIRPVDFNGDGVEELVLVYNSEAERSSYSVGEYTWEVWSYENGQTLLLASDALYTTDGGAQSVILTRHDGNWYLVCGSADDYEYNYYFGFGKDNFGLVREALMVWNSDSSISYYISGTPVEAEQWTAENEAWWADAETYRMNYVADAGELLKMYSDAKALLGVEASVTSDTAVAVPEGDYILPNSSREYITRETLQGLSADELLIARNEIFARHGRKFSTPELQQYFESKSWYVPKYTPEEFEAIQYTELSEIEWANVDLINTLEAEAPVSDTSDSVSAPVSQTTSAYSSGQTVSTGSSVQTTGVPVDDPERVFGQLPTEFWFSSGAGAWGTDLQLSSDGSFTGQYHDSDMGDIGEGYPNGSVYLSDFGGKFTSLQKISDTVYSMKLESIELEKAPGEQYIEDGILYICSEPYGMEDAEDFLIYLPGTPLSSIDTEFLKWAFLDPGLTALPSNFYGIYNVNAQHGFVSY